jgi:hypothetical protein
MPFTLADLSATFSRSFSCACLTMLELNQIYQKHLDASQHCPCCQSAMLWVEGEYYYKDIQFHHCTHCQHSIYYGEQPMQCHCDTCLKQRKKAIQAARFDERKAERQKKREQQDNVEFLLDDLTLLDKLFLLSLVDGLVDEHSPHHEWLDFAHYYPLQIAPSYQLFKQLKQRFIQQDYVIPQQHGSEKYYTNLRLHGYREPSILSIAQQLRAWFYADFTQGVPYKNSDEVKHTLLTLFAHEVVNFCQYHCQKWQIQFYANQQLIDYCKVLLNDLAVQQVFYLANRALQYLHEQKLLDKSNQNFVNTNRLRKTLMQYRELGQQQSWETATLQRPADLMYSQMSYIFIERLLGLGEQAFQQPLWKSWQDILPRLRFFTDRHCIHCGSRDLTIEYSAKDAVSFSCLRCKQQDHYFVE